jgi:chloramphenicol-sensitive protein RarD
VDRADAGVLVRALGLVKKRAGVGGTESLAVETALLLLPALAYLAFLGVSGRGTFTTEGPGHMALIAAGGIATAVPLMLFGAAANSLPLSTLGVLQYLAPVMHFAIGVSRTASRCR